MKFAFLCDTPFQVFNCVNFVYHNVESSKFDSDIYVMQQFSSSEKITQKLRESGLFSNVYEVAYYYSKPSPVSKLVTLKQTIFPQKNLVKHIYPKIDFTKKKYDVLVMATPIYFCFQFASCFPSAKVYFIDDGTGSYKGNIVESMTTGTFRLLHRFMNKGPLSLQIEKLYINNPDLCKSTVAPNICALPKWDNKDETYDKLLCSIFSVTEEGVSQYKNQHAIFLQQPLMQEMPPERVEEVERNLFEQIKNRFPSFLVRLHPREKRREVYEQYPVDRMMCLWELICAKEITDNTVLIGAFSTAQFIPKMIFDKEPYLIFTFHLYSPNTFFDSKKDEITNTIETLRSHYRNPEKIKIIQSMDEI